MQSGFIQENVGLLIVAMVARLFTNCSLIVPK